MLSSVDEIKSKLDIVDIISEYFPLKQAGINFKAVCPFHQEKTASFSVNRERQFFHCFGCHESGDMFSFIQKMENIEFPEALKILANKAGVVLPEYNPREANLKTRVLEIEQAAAEWFVGQLNNSEAGKKTFIYLAQGRKLTEGTIKEWQLGYAPDSWDKLGSYLKNKNYTQEEILQSGLVVEKDRGGYYDRFRCRAMFPIEDYHGNIVGFTGRALKKEENAKYINSPQTVVYNKSEVIFGLYKAKRFIKNKDAVVIVEGNMDVIASFQAGVKNVVAVSGTAMTIEQIKILKRLTNNFIFAFDGDTAGVRAAERSISLAWQEEVNVKVVAINKDIGKDPDDIVKQNPEIWSKMVNDAQLAMDYFFDLNLANYKPEDIESKKIVGRNLLNLIIKLKNSIEKDYYIKKLSEKINVSEVSLREDIGKVQSSQSYDKKDKKIENMKNKNINSLVEKKVKIAERLMAYMLIDSDYFNYISQNMDINYLPIDAQELYKQINVYYTTEYKVGDDNKKQILAFISKCSFNLMDQLQSLMMIVEDESGKLTYNETENEIKKYIFYLKHEFIKEELYKINKQIERIEKGGMGNTGDEQLQNLMGRYTQLSNELK